LKRRKKILLIIATIVGIGFLIPQNLMMPVINATAKDYNQNSYWAYPWGKSVTHKGVDIFAKKGTNIISATKGVVLYTGNYYPAGKFVIILGPKWRFHYYAHLNDIKTSMFSYVNNDVIIGTVGKTGNAKNTPAHLHYVVATPFPYFWKIDKDIEGWMKAFILNPIDYFRID